MLISPRHLFPAFRALVNMYSWRSRRLQRLQHSHGHPFKTMSRQITSQAQKLALQFNQVIARPAGQVKLMNQAFGGWEASGAPAGQIF